MASDSSSKSPSIFVPLAVGTIVTLVLSGTLVIAGLKAGILPGTSPLVILFAWGAFARYITKDTGREFLNTAQVAGSAGVAVTAGVIFTAPVIQILYRDKFGSESDIPPVDVPTLIYLSIAGALIGFGFVGFGARKFLSDPTLPAPEARSCHTMIEAAVASPSKRPNLYISMFAGLLASAMAPFLSKVRVATSHIILHSNQPEDGMPAVDRPFEFVLPFEPIFMGIGALLTLSTAILVFGGSLLRLIGDYILASVDPGSPIANDFPEISMKWIGGGAMTVAVVYSLVRLFSISTPKADSDENGQSVLAISRGHRITQALAIAAGFLMIAAWLWEKDGFTSFSISMMIAILVCCGLMVVLGALLSLQIGSSASPVSGTVFVTILVLCIIAIITDRRQIEDVMLIVPLAVAACVAICAANDSSQDFKTLQLCGLPIQKGFLPQIVGLLAGCIAVPIVLFIADKAYGLGTEELTAPQASLFATVLDALLLQEGGIASSWKPIAVGVTIGVLAVIAEIVGKRRGMQLPSMAFAVGIYLPHYLGVGIMIGAIARFIGDRGQKQRAESILAAAGLIAGAALFELLIGGLIVVENINERFVLSSEAKRNVVAMLGIATLCAIIFFNSRPKASSDDATA